MVRKRLSHIFPLHEEGLVAFSPHRLFREKFWRHLSHTPHPQAEVLRVSYLQTFDQREYLGSSLYTLPFWGDLGSSLPHTTSTGRKLSGVIPTHFLFREKVWGCPPHKLPMKKVWGHFSHASSFRGKNLLVFSSHTFFPERCSKVILSTHSFYQREHLNNIYDVTLYYKFLTSYEPNLHKLFSYSVETFTHWEKNVFHYFKNLLVNLFQMKCGKLLIRENQVQIHFLFISHCRYKVNKFLKGSMKTPSNTIF